MPHKPIQKVCEICGKDFWAGRPNQPTCSMRCGGVLTAQKRRANGLVRQPCSEEGCNRLSHGRGLCLMHLKRVLRSGSTKLIRNRRPEGMSVLDWFMSKVKKTEDCWIWIDSVAEKRGGYGTFYDADRGKKIRAHHYLVPDLPSRADVGEKMEYDHLCGNVRCVRPEHLEMVTARENRRRQHRRNK